MKNSPLGLDTDGTPPYHERTCHAIHRIRFVRCVENLKAIMMLLREGSSPITQYEAYCIFRIFVVNPHVPHVVRDAYTRMYSCIRIQTASSFRRLLFACAGAYIASPLSSSPPCVEAHNTQTSRTHTRAFRSSTYLRATARS